ncbi:sensor histidine kinase [Undibacterium sp. Ji50W]|uniref:sensor histidine kinase n=1 Tax=Undibacterium sp. Ji50W TaxID=3413041 RepID=UPI003BEF7B19
MSTSVFHQLSPPWVPPRYGKAPYFWLLSFAIFGMKYLYVAPSIREILLLAASLTFFLPVYFYSFWNNGWRTYACILVVCFMGIIWAPFNFGSSTFCIFAATMCSRIPDTRKAYQFLWFIGCIIVAASVGMRLEKFFWLPAIIFSIPSGLGAIISERLTLSNENLLRKQEEVEHLAALAERERIARDLHDLLGHTLSVITLKAELAGKLFDKNPDASKKEISDIEHTARQALAEVRAAVIGYRATGLLHELQSAKNALSAAAVELETELETDIEKMSLPAAIENVMALAVREAVTNIIRHAQASICKISLATHNGQVELCIADDGVAKNGSDGKQAMHKGSGLTGMSERVQALGGTLDIRIEQGLTLHLSLPLKEST